MRRLLPWAGASIVTLLLVTGAGCRRGAANGVERIAILPFENLSPDRSLDWMSRAIPEIAAYELGASPSAQVFFASSVGDAYNARATAALHGYFSTANGRTRMNMDLEELPGNRIRLTRAVDTATGVGPKPLADAVAAMLGGGKVRPFGNAQTGAIRNWVDGQAAGDPKSAAAAFEKAVAMDPDFGAAYVGWARSLISQGEREDARRVIEAAGQRGDALNRIDRTELTYLDAALRGDTEDQLRTAAELTRLLPGNSDLIAMLGQGEVQRRQYSKAVQWLQKAAQLDPRNGERWNQLAYAQAYAGNLDGARESLAQFAAVDPANANASDSLGDVNFYWGRFTEAERAYLEANHKNPAFLGGGPLLKAAQAHLMTGDAAGADVLFNRYADYRKQLGDSQIGMLRAEWEYQTGRRAQALARMAEAARQPELAALALAQLAAWSLEGGDAAKARQYTGEAVAQLTPAARALVTLCQFLTQPATSATDWAVRAERELPGPQAAMYRKHALAYALLLAKDYREASLVLKELCQTLDPMQSGQDQALLAWALVEQGRFGEAGALLKTFPVPENAGLPLFGSLAFPRIFELRAQVLEKQGKHAEAQTSLALFKKLS